MSPYAQPDETPLAFEVCHGYGCQARSSVRLTEAQWQSVLAAFEPLAQDASAERVQIAEAVGRMEALATHSAGLRPDEAKAQTPRRDDHAMDCIDETVNTDRTLRFLADAGVLRFHAVADVVHRGYFLDGQWPHNSAAVQDKVSGHVYVIDSYYEDNGKPAHIHTLGDWFSGES